MNGRPCRIQVPIGTITFRSTYSCPAIRVTILEKPQGLYLPGRSVLFLRSRRISSLPFRTAVTTSSTVGMKCVLNRSEEHTSELQSREKLVCRLLLEKK